MITSLRSHVLGLIKRPFWISANSCNATWWCWSGLYAWHITFTNMNFRSFLATTAWMSHCVHMILIRLNKTSLNKRAILPLKDFIFFFSSLLCVVLPFVELVCIWNDWYMDGWMDGQEMYLVLIFKLFILILVCLWLCLLYVIFRPQPFCVIPSLQHRWLIDLSA